MSKNSSNPWARLIGHSFAHLQGAVDTLADWGFKQMKQVGKQPESEPRPDENKYWSMVKKVGKAGLTFVGTVGDEFYSEYAKIKAKEQRKKH